MKTKMRVLTALGIFCSLLLFQPAVADQAAEQQAVHAAEAWLALVDGGAYAESWDTAAAYFKGAVRRDQWEATIRGAREPLGKVLSRRLSSKQYFTSLPGAPDGHYVVIQYQTSFEGKSSAVETVTPMRDNDGKWRVSGYYIR